jgi:hypothetical protein
MPSTLPTDGESCSASLLTEQEQKAVSDVKDVENGKNSENSEVRNSLISAARAAYQTLIEKICKDEKNAPTKNTPLHLAAMSGSADRVKNLVENGADLLLENKDKYTALSIILNNIPNGENLLMEILNKNIKVEDGKEEIEISLNILCPPEHKNKMAIVDRLYSSHTNKKKLLNHPVLKALIHSKWKDFQYYMWYRALIFFLYLLLLTIFVFTRDRIYAGMARYCLFILSAHLISFCFPYCIPGHYSWTRRITKILLLAVAPILTLVSVSIQYNAEWCGIAYLLSWLSIPLYCTSFDFISHQAGMFIFVTKEVFKHCLVFFFVLAGFAITFYVLCHDISSDKYQNFWYTFLYTSLVLLQGDSLGDNHTIRRNNTADITIKRGYVTYVTGTLSSMRFASIITSLLFLLLVIIVLLNMLVALAVREANEILEYGQVYQLRNRTQVLYECYEVLNFLSEWLPKCLVQFCKNLAHCTDKNGEDKNKIEDRDIPRSMRNELTYLYYKCKGENKGLDPLMNEMEELMNEKIPTLISQIQELRKS